MKYLLTIAMICLSSSAFSQSVRNDSRAPIKLDQCNPKVVDELLHAYADNFGPVTTDQLEQATPIIGSDPTPFEYVVKFVMSYQWTCAFQTPGGQPVNLAMSINLNQTLACMPPSGQTVKTLFVLWMNQCWQQLNGSYSQE